MARTATNTAVKAKLAKLNGAVVHGVELGDKAADAVKAKLAAARAQVKELRAEREAEAAKLAAAQAELDRLAALKAAQPDHRDAVQDRLASALDEFMSEFEAPSWKRVIAGAVLGIVLSGCAGWCIGFVTSYLIAGIVALTGMAFLGWVVYVLGLVMSLLAGAHIGSKAFGYVASGAIDAHIAGAKNRVRGWFARGDVVQYTGAHTA